MELSASRPTRRCLAGGALLLPCLALSTLAAASPLRVALSPLVLKPRTAAPMPVEVRLRWDGTRLLEGRLELEFRDGGRVLTRYRSAELALTAGEQTVRWLLPPLPPTYDPQIQAHLTFVAGTDRHETDAQFLPAALASERSLVVALCSTREGTSDAMRDIEQSLRLERFRPAPAKDEIPWPLTTTTARLTPEDLPEQPLAYCAYDAVVLTADALASARSRQLEALGRWVEAGGSVCVLGAGDAKPETLRLATGRAVEEALLGEASSGRPISLAYSGTGRCVLVPTSLPDVDMDSATWREAAAFLWKVRASVSREIVHDGRWLSPPAGAAIEPLIAEEPGPAPARQGFAVPVRPPSELIQKLMPQTVHLVPFFLIVLLLALFALVIGPLDWFVLGWLRRRRYTWLLFPLSAFAFTAAMVLLANRALGQRDQRHGLVIVDVGTDGDVLRENRYELVFPVRDGQRVTELRDALWAPLDSSEANSYYPYYGPAYRYRRGDNANDTPLMWEGAVPTCFRVVRAVHQWQPLLSRTFSIGPSRALPLRVPWDVVDGLIHSNASETEWRRRLAALGATSVTCCVFAKQRCDYLVNGGALSMPLIAALCESNGRGLEAIVAQVSPTGGANIEDAPCYDPTDARQRLVVLLAQVGDDTVMCRKVYHGQ